MTTTPDVTELESTLLAEVTAADSLEELEAVRVSVLGRKGRITEQMKGLGSLDGEARKAAGQTLNRVKDTVTAAISAHQLDLEAAALEVRLAGETTDVTLPVRPRPDGRIHPVSQAMEECIAIFGEMGFAVAEGPDIEDDFHNFTALNIPPEHPARQMHDTFYLPERDDGSRLVLRTHTSPVQIRVMENQEPPVKIIAPGKVYRCDADVSHSPVFHQVEGLLVDRNVTFSDLRGTLSTFVHGMFGPDVGVRFRPSFFPFTEPSAEVDIQCVICRGQGCRVCAGSGWVEILGAGMVDPAVYGFVGYDPEEVTGFAFGLGVERVAMLKYGIDDIRLFFENDIRFLSQF